MALPRSVGFVCGLLGASALVGRPVTAQRSQGAPVTVSPAPTPMTQLAGLLNRPNTLVTQDLYRVNNSVALSCGLVIDAVVASATTPTPTRLQGLRVEVADPSQPAQTRQSYVDGTELAGLSQGLGQMANLTAQWTGREESRASEGRYGTLDGFLVGFHQDNRSQQGYVAAGVVDPIRRACQVQEFAQIKQGVDDAITLLSQRGGL